LPQKEDLDSYDF